MKHSHSLGRLQLFAEVARLGFHYATIVREVERSHNLPDKPLHDSLEAYVELQSPDFYDLHAFACIRIWSTIEAFVSDVACFSLRTIPEVKQSSALAKLKGPLIEYASASEPRQAELMFQLLESQVNAPLKAGVGRFEATLKSLGLGGGVHQRVRDALYDCSNYRNCIVHNDGIIDHALVTAIPVFESVKGTRLGITPKDARRFLYAAFWYMLEIQRRIVPDDFDGLTILRSEQAQYLDWLDSGGPSPTSLPFPDVATRVTRHN